MTSTRRSSVSSKFDLFELQSLSLSVPEKLLFHSGIFSEASGDEAAEPSAGRGEQGCAQTNNFYGAPVLQPEILEAYTWRCSHRDEPGFYVASRTICVESNKYV